MVAAKTSEESLTRRFARRTRLGMLVALVLVAALGLNGCISFGMIAGISAIVGGLNALGVFGDGAMSEFLGKAALIGGIVGLAGGLIWNFNTPITEALGMGGGAEAAGSQTVSTVGGTGSTGSTATVDTAASSSTAAGSWTGSSAGSGPASGATAVPASGATAVPASGATAVPASGAAAVPASGATAVPASGATAVPASGAGAGAAVDTGVVNTPSGPGYFDSQQDQMWFRRQRLPTTRQA